MATPLQEVTSGGQTHSHTWVSITSDNIMNLLVWMSLCLMGLNVFLCCLRPRPKVLFCRSLLCVEHQFSSVNVHPEWNCSSEFNPFVWLVLSCPPLSPSSCSDEPAAEESVLKLLGGMVMSCYAKYWIYVCGGMFIMVSFAGKLVGYKIVYMLLFLICLCLYQVGMDSRPQTAFVLLLERPVSSPRSPVGVSQVYYSLWRRLLKLFWWLVVAYTMLVLISIYTYQFEDFPGYWRNFTGFTEEQYVLPFLTRPAICSWPAHAATSSTPLQTCSILYISSEYSRLTMCIKLTNMQLFLIQKLIWSNAETPLPRVVSVNKRTVKYLNFMHSCWYQENMHCTMTQVMMC